MSVQALSFHGGALDMNSPLRMRESRRVSQSLRTNGWQLISRRQQRRLGYEDTSGARPRP